MAGKSLTFENHRLLVTEKLRNFVQKPGLQFTVDCKWRAQTMFCLGPSIPSYSAADSTRMWIHRVPDHGGWTTDYSISRGANANVLDLESGLIDIKKPQHHRHRPRLPLSPEPFVRLACRLYIFVSVMLPLCFRATVPTILQSLPKRSENKIKM